MKFDKLAEIRMKQAERDGELEGLAGEGKPLKPGSGGNSVEAFGYGAMAGEGVLPEEIELRKLIAKQEATLAEVTDADARKQEMKKLVDLQMRLSMQEEARRKYFSS